MFRPLLCQKLAIFMSSISSGTHAFSQSTSIQSMIKFDISTSATGRKGYANPWTLTVRQMQKDSGAMITAKQRSSLIWMQTSSTYPSNGLDLYSWWKSQIYCRSYLCLTLKPLSSVRLNSIIASGSRRHCFGVERRKIRSLSMLLILRLDFS